MYFMSDPQALHVTRNVIPGKLGVDLHLHRVHIHLVIIFSLYKPMSLVDTYCTGSVMFDTADYRCPFI